MGFRTTLLGALSAALTVLVLAGCAGGGGGPNAGRYASDTDAYPSGHKDLSSVKDAVPRVEPRSKGGNGPTYNVLGKTYRVLDDANGYSEVGLASFYGTKFNGYATSNGERYDMYGMSAAHKTLPLPTYVRVTNLANGRHVIVKVNDRGPFHSDRIIDLSYAAAYKLGYLDQGTARVKVEAIDPRHWNARDEASTPAAASSPGASSQPQATAGSGSGSTYLQVAAVGNVSAAEQLRQTLASKLGVSGRVVPFNGMYRVQIGPWASSADVESARRQLEALGYARPMTVADTP
ncbi:septal ring lytic transglycosylase RlpA family protein [Carnimonas nigrificans]|uniref:septal ring lytic transglycosylase RlpA family protein n=1 Tax=Carnimonas nigrificans TaxID=64323 RepID=UPI000471AEC5|nr:septal ring lytic transglycosylase RlpA family protein [Carnimonas nigrificans]